MQHEAEQITVMQVNSGKGHLRLPAALDLAAAESFLDMMRQQLTAQTRLHVDASEVQSLTIPCVQIILAALRDCPQITIDNHSEVFTAAFEDLGFNLAELCLSRALEPEEQDAGPKPVGDADCTPFQSEQQNMAKRILTIDDSKTIRDMLLLTLADAGFEVLQAVDGQDGLDVLCKEQVDVVITDINMPRMDGYEVIRQMRKNDAYKSMPILVLTTESEAEKKNLARVAGATGWMVKPFDPDRLIATINKVLPAAA
jgi:two-component system, chemotaxis family, chemotaxis protein CheY